MVVALLVLGLSFILGSIPTGVVFTRLFWGRDIRLHGSGNIGAANVTRTAGVKIGALVALSDIAKGVLPIVFGRAVELDPPVLALVAVIAVLGHDYSLFLHFRGGKGVATTLGALVALAPVPGVLAMLVWTVVFALSRYSSLASLSALGILPVVLVLTGQSASFVAAGIVLLLLGIWKHRENIIRLSSGKEPRFQRSRRPSGP